MSLGLRTNYCLPLVSSISLPGISTTLPAVHATSNNSLRTTTGPLRALACTVVNVPIPLWNLLRGRVPSFFSVLLWWNRRVNRRGVFEVRAITCPPVGEHRLMSRCRLSAPGFCATGRFPGAPCVRPREWYRGLLVGGLERPQITYPVVVSDVG